MPERETSRSIKLKKNNKIDVGSSVCVLKVGISTDDKISILYNSDFFIEKKITKTLDKKAYTDESITTIKLAKIGNRINKI